LVRGVSGYFEVRFDVDELVALVPIPPDQAREFLDGEAAKDDVITLPLHPWKHADVAAKTDFDRYAEVLETSAISMKWGSTSESGGGTSFTSPEQLATFHTRRSELLIFALEFTPKVPGSGGARLTALVDAVRRREATVMASLGPEHGALVAAPASFAGHPFGLATFDGDRVVRLLLPFGTGLLDGIRKRLVAEDVPLVRLSAAQAQELARKGDLARYGEVLAVESVTLHGSVSPAPTFDSPDRVDELRAAVRAAFSSRLEFTVRSPN
jgi:hypothetical protein